MTQSTRRVDRARESALALVGALLIPCLIFVAVARPLPGTPTSSVTLLPSSLKPSDLDELLAPIALYPDALLAQILSAATDPQQLLDAGNWLLRNQTLEPADRSAAGMTLGFGPATRSLLQFPTVVDMMCSQLDWTRQLGEATRASEASVLEAVQRLRRQAVAVGSLTSSMQQRVISLPDGDATLVTVQPVTPFIYVPIYDPRVVYSKRSSARTEASDERIGVPAVMRFVAFAEGIRIADAFDSEYGPEYVGAAFSAYYGSTFSNRDQSYHPVYGQGFPRAESYSRSARYRYAYDGRGLRIQNSDYFRQFAGNANLLPDHRQLRLAKD